MIEVGEYVRTHKGDIHKVIGIREEQRDGKRVYSHKAYYLDSKKGSLTSAFIQKHSKNIIDLIEVGDYVNGYKVEKKEDGYIYVDYCWDCELYTMVTNEVDNIKSIVTKEMMKSVEYRNN